MGHTVKINESDEYEWYIPENKIDELIRFLDKLGCREPCE